MVATNYHVVEGAASLKIKTKYGTTMDIRGIAASDSENDVVILSACVQMPSLEAVQVVQDRIGKPVISAAIATTYFLLKEMGLKPVVPNAGALLSGAY